MLPTLLTRADIPEDAITVSPSQISLFYKCEWKWFLAKKQNREPFSMSSHPMDLGTMLHKFMEKWYGMFLGRPVELLDSMQTLALMETVQSENNWTDYESALKIYNVFTVFCTYMQWAARKETLIPLGVEVETFAPTGLVSTDGRPIYYHGIIDLIAERNGHIGPGDHKSHTSRSWNQEEVDFDLQLFFYMLLLLRQDVYVDFAMINTINLYLPKESKKDPGNVQRSLQDETRFARFFVEHSNYSLEKFESEIHKIIRKMWCNPDHEYAMRITRDCKRCGFREPCSMSLHGVDVQPILLSKFTKTTMTATDFDIEELEEDTDSFVLPDGD